MICITGGEPSLPELASRLEAADTAGTPRTPGTLHEIRADLLSTMDDALFDLVARHADRVLFCCRAARQGGGFTGSEGQRLGVLARAHQRGARYVDLEDDVPLDGFDRARVVLSWHDHEGTGDVMGKTRTMAERGAGVVKIAVRVEDAADLDVLRQARAAIAGPAVVIGMGPAGVLSRIRYGAFGSAWTYATSSDATAPGQLALAETTQLGLPESASAPYLALAGGEQVLRSPGPRAYNALFRARRSLLSYIPLVTRSLERTLALCEATGAAGVSVTMPLKAEALGLCRPDGLARSVGSVNSLRRADGGWEGTNTDVEGVRIPLEQARATGTALVLGRGGAARAAIHACRELGLGVQQRARREGTWSERTRVPHDVLIQATPALDAWPEDEPLRAAIVFDLALGAPSRLLERARAEGRTAIDPLEMWIHQGARQMTWMGIPTRADELREMTA